MRVLAARFPDRERASAALTTLHSRLDDGLEADIAPLAAGVADDSATLLAGHFSEDATADVVEIVHESGGEMVANVDERWTIPRFNSHDSDAW